MKKLILPVITLFLFAASAFAESLAGYSKAELTVRGMSCPLCSNNIDGRLKKVEGVSDVHINLETGLVTVTFTEGAAPTREAMAKAIKDAGFTLGDVELIK